MRYAKQQISRVWRNYDKWVGNQTLEDHALRVTAQQSPERAAAVPVEQGGGIGAPRQAVRLRPAWLPRYLFFLGLTTIFLGALLALIYLQLAPDATDPVPLQLGLVSVLFVFIIINGVLLWLLTQVHAHEETDKQLQRAKEQAEQAEQANQAKSRYLTGISHELRTPLQSMLGYAQLLLRRRSLPPSDLNALQIIHRSGEYLADLIEGLLDISKIEAGRLDIYRNEVNLPELIRQLDQMFRDQAEIKGLHFVCVVEGRLPTLVITDEKRLRQILINLLSNAIKYTPAGTVEFHIHYRNQVAEFRVCDTGVGIAAQDLERVLMPFERVSNASAPSVSGTGLGLTIVKLLVELLGGELRISSTPGKGSEFTVSLLLPWKQTTTPAITERRVTGFTGPARCVMVVDDEPLHRGLIAELLQPLGFRVVEATDAVNCLGQLEQMPTHPDLFVLDVNMPGMNGLELAARLRELQYAEPIMVMSADARERHGAQCEATNCDAWLVKPVKHQTLLQELGRLLDLEWQLAEPAPVVVNAEPGNSQLEIPDTAECRELLAYAKIGYRSGVQKQLDLIDAQALVDADALRLLRRLSDNMQFARIVQLLSDQFEQTTQG